MQFRSPQVLNDSRENLSRGDTMMSLSDVLVRGVPIRDWEKFEIRERLRHYT